MGGMGNIALNEWLLLEAPICNPSVRHWALAEWPVWEAKRTGRLRHFTCAKRTFSLYAGIDC